MDAIVSVRMPSSLVEELKILAEKNHFMDLSDELRSIVRNKCLSYNDSYSEELKKFRIELKDELKEQKTKQQIVEDLKKIIDELKNETK